MELNKSKIQSPLIVIDPVQAGRNAAAALSFEKYDLLRKKAKEFLKCWEISKKFPACSRTRQERFLTQKSEKYFEEPVFYLNMVKKENIIV